MAFNTTTLSKYGVFPAKGGYSCSENSNNGNVEKEFSFNYILLGSPDPTSEFYYETDADAKAAFVNFIYLTYGNEPYYRDGSAVTDPEYPLSSISIQLSSEYKYRWDCSCTFKNLDDTGSSEDETPTTDPIIGTTDIKYTLGTVNRHILNAVSKETKYVAQGWTETNFGNRINVQDGNVIGTDVIQPTLNFQIAVNFSQLSAIDMQIIMGMVGTINNATWGVFEPGTVLFRGGDFSAEKWTKDDGYDGIYWKANFNFEFSPPEIITNPDSTTFVKGGWDYVWDYQNKVISASGATADLITQRTKNQIYKSTDFSYLGVTWRQS